MLRIPGDAEADLLYSLGCGRRGGGLYRGGYQFDYHTWNDVASRHFPWLIGVDPAAAEPYWHDAMARALFTERGRQPWPVCGRRI